MSLHSGFVVIVFFGPLAVFLSGFAVKLFPILAALQSHLNGQPRINQQTHYGMLTHLIFVVPVILVILVRKLIETKNGQNVPPFQRYNSKPTSQYDEQL